MGKLALLLVAAVAIGSSVLLLRSDSNRLRADELQVARQEEALAREIARSAYNLIISRARQLEVEHRQWTVAQLVEAVNGPAGKLSGELKGGSYEAWLYMIGGANGASYGAIAVGYYGKAQHQIGSQRVLRSVLEVDQPSRVKVKFLESMAGYCSAIYLQRYVPRPDGSYEALEPELVFAPGNNRDGAEALHTTTLNPGERANFILAVDADNQCERRGDRTVPWNDRFYEYHRFALQESIDDFKHLQEGPYVLIQPHPDQPNTWRLAFEDLDFDRQPMGYDKLLDIKQYGYGDMKWRVRSGMQWGERNGKYSYGGPGWHERNSNGYYKLRDFYTENGGNPSPRNPIVPDFSDQVIEVTFIPNAAI